MTMPAYADQLLRFYNVNIGYGKSANLTLSVARSGNVYTLTVMALNATPLNSPTLEGLWFQPNPADSTTRRSVGLTWKTSNSIVNLGIGRRIYSSDGAVAVGPVTLTGLPGPDQILEPFGPARFSGIRDIYIGDPVSSVNGEFYSNHTDLEISGPLPIKIGRVYSSKNKETNGLGYGWLWTTSPCLVVAADVSTVQATNEDGSVIVFRRQGTTETWLPEASDNPGAGNSGAGGNIFAASIIRTTSGSDVFYEWKIGNGSSRLYKVRSFPKAGSLYERPYILSHTDSSGNVQSFTFGANSSLNDYGKINQIRCSNGIQADFVYDGSGRLLTATAADGRVVQYTYYSGGDLKDVTLPDNSKTTYVYGESSPGVSNHLIIRETKPDGRVLENRYDALGRVDQQKATVDPAQPGVLVVNATFDYSVPGQTTVTDAYNRSTIYEYTDGLITAIREPESRTTLKEWYTTTDTPNGAYQRSLKKITDPRGLVTEYKYDAQGNVTETKLTGDLDGDPATPATETSTTTSLYNSLNRPETVTTETGATVSYFYEDTDYPYLPTTLTTTQSNSTLRVDKLTYSERSVTVSGVTTFARGLLETKTIAYGTSDEAVTTYDYDATGFRTSETRATGTSDPSVVLTYAPTARREVLSVTDSAGRSTAFTYDGLSRVRTTTVKDELAATLAATETIYTANGEISKTDGPRSGPEDWVEHDYDQAGRPKEDRVYRTQAKADGTGVEAPPAGTLKAVTTYRHDLFGNLTLVIDPRGHATTYQYDGLGRLTHTRRFAATHAAALLAQNAANLAAKQSYNGTLPSGVTALSVETFTYEAGGEVAVRTSVLGGTTTTLYNSRGQPRKLTLADNSVLEWRYQTDGRLSTEILRNGTYWETTYDDVARTVTRTLKKPDSTVLASETRTFDRRGNLVSTTDAEGYVRTTTYDDLDRPKTVTGPAGTPSSATSVLNYTYDAAGITHVVSNSLGETTVTTRDALGRITRVEVRDAANSPVRVTSYAYSADHHAVTVTEGTGADAIVLTSYTDEAGRPLLTRFADSTFTRQTYDLGGYPYQSTDALNRTTTTFYNALGQLSTQTLPDTHVTTFLRDAAGNLLERQMPSPQGTLVAKSTYDTAGRLLTSRLLNGTTESRLHTYAYYPSGAWTGLLQTTTAPRATVTTTYDDYLRPLTVSSSGLSAPDSQLTSTTTYAYDKRGLVTSVTQSSPSDAAGPTTEVSRTYDGYGQLLTETLAIGGSGHSAITQTWNAAGRRASLNEAGSSLTAPLFGYAYRADGRLTQVSTLASGLSSLDFSFAYADNGLLASRTNPYRTLTVNDRDDLGRIKQQTTTVAATTAMTETLNYRADGTLDDYAVTRSGTGTWNETRDYDYNNRGQLTSEGFSPAPAATAALAYKFDNNAIGLGIRTDAKVGPGAPAAWQSKATAINPLARVTTDQTNAAGRDVPASGVSLGANYVELIVDGRPAGRADHPGWADNVGTWSKNLTLGAGSHTLTASAVHPSGHYTATATSTFGVEVPLVTVTAVYDTDGNITTRSFSSGMVQTLTWDAFNRLIKVAQRDASNHGYDWTAVYDAFGRRLKTTQQPITAGVASGTATVIASIYDPQAEFLEIGVAVNGVKAWKVYGPDLNGVYGALNGTGGLEATILDADGTTKAVLNDSFGNGVATVSS